MNRFKTREKGRGNHVFSSFFNQRGVTLFEVLISLVLISILFFTLQSVIGATAKSKQASENELTLIQEAKNQLEQQVRVIELQHPTYISSLPANSPISVYSFGVNIESHKYNGEITAEKIGEGEYRDFVLVRSKIVDSEGKEDAVEVDQFVSAVH